MARPRKTGLDYFPHDVDATTDPKLEPAIMKYGASAYAFYFVHLEYCYRSSDLSIDVSDTETGTEMKQVIQRKLHINEQEYNNILKTLLRHDAFNAEHYLETGKLTSNGVHKRAKAVLEKRARALEAYESSENKEKESNKEKEIYNKLNKSKVKETTQETTQETTPEITVSAAETIPETTQKHIKIIKPEKTKYADTVHMQESEYKKLCDNYGEPFALKCIEKLDLYKGSKGKKYKDDYKAILSWVVEQIKKDCPGLMERQFLEKISDDPPANPFEKYKWDVYEK